MRLLIISDTHVPTRARDLPARVWDEVDAADVVIHAGDWMDVALLDALEERSARLIACWGNNDGPELRERLPEVARATLDGVRLAVTHEAGASAGREKRMARAFPDTDVLVFGHSHIPWDTTAPLVSEESGSGEGASGEGASGEGGLRLLNPGSPTDRRRQPYCTYMTATIAEGTLRDVNLHRLPPRR
ncbi:metallophosphoesterase family protein [Dietzia massiliensis]|uniref:metallophosphoesterase family protein n=1 Tax=Dietzia massiliensis TaxID=2697499 RepID=UPI001BCD8EF3|nr:metallophosphoesterase [Dietzia massiliensis]MBS7547944.1 metallophosphoesterase [Dietzia massiliensis]